MQAFEKKYIKMKRNKNFKVISLTCFTQKMEYMQCLQLN